MSKGRWKRIYHLNQAPRRKPNPVKTMSAIISLRKPHASTASVDALDWLAGAGRSLMSALLAIQPRRETVPAYARRDAGLPSVEMIGLDWTNAEVRRVRL